MTIADRLARARQLRLQDAFDEARSQCQEVLAEAPGNAEAMGLLGICDIETGAIDSGRAWLDRAEAADPQNASVHLYRSFQYEAQGLDDAALQAARRAGDCDATRFDIWGRIGDLAGRAGDYTLAAECFGRALAVDTDHPARLPVALRLAGLQLELGDADEAERAIEIAERTARSGELPADAHAVRAAIAQKRGDWPALAVAAQDWLKAAPDDGDARGALSQALAQQGYYRRAIEVFKPVVEQRGEDADALAALGRLVLGARDTTEARGIFERALAIDPECAEAQFGLARSHLFHGDIAEAEAACRRTIAADADHLEAYGLLCEVSGGRIADAELARLETTVRRPGLAADKLSIGLFALGDAYHRRQRREAAFQTWSEANRTKWIQHTGRSVSAYDRNDQDRRVDWLCKAFGALAEDAETARSEPVPIFIVGMPRSGTTLLEAAISAHTEVVAGGELSAMPFIFSAFERWARSSGWTGGAIPAEKLAEWRRIYVDHLREYGLEAARWVTDKQPGNIMSVGLIRQLFPASPVFHIRRRPVETAFSIYRRNFTRQWPFAHDLSDIAHYYASQARLGAYWAETFPGRVTAVQYEQLVEDFEAQLRQVLARAGLSWDRQCLTYYEQDRTVMTFSAAQVRKPPSPEHLDSTSPYKAWLKPFAEALADYPVDPETGVWLGPSENPARQANGEPDRARSGGLLGRLFGRSRKERP